MALGVLALAMVVVAAAPDRADAACVGATTTFNFGDTVTEDCTFNADMARPVGTTGHGLVVGAAGITIDGNGYLLDGVTPACIAGLTNDAGVYSFSYSNVTIQNLEIANFCHGIEINGGPPNFSTGNTIKSCEIHDNGDATATTGAQTMGIQLNYVENSLVTANKIYHQTGAGGGPPGGNGVHLCKGDDNEFSYNQIYNNGAAGFFVRCASKRTHYHHNYIHDNNLGGIYQWCKNSDNALAEFNTSINDQVGGGIAFGGQGGNEAKNNTTNGNATYGIGFDRDATAGYVEGNTSLNNTTFDIYAKTGVTVTGDHNNCDTTFNYDDASAGAGNGCQYSSSNPPPEVPTANEWGLAFMIVLLLTAGLYTMRRRNQE
jgi:hypothetical protein